jgi:F420-dependent oxidoreductase-like protein
MATKHPLRFGIKTAPQHTTYEDMLRVWQEADGIDLIEHAWLFDHFYPIGDTDHHGPCLEGWTLLAALAGQTQRLRVGIMVTGNTYRHPAVLANMGATVDVISNGRLDFGIGAGWNEEESSAYGIPLYAPGERIRRLGEACEVIRRLWTERSATFEGRYYRLHDAYCEPKPVQKPHPPFVIGGSGEQKTLRVTAQYANIWNFVGGPPDLLQHKLAVLAEHCQAVGRNFDDIEISVQMYYDPDDPASVLERMRSYIAAGATHLIFTMRWPYPEHVAHRLTDDVLMPLRQDFV